MEKEKFTQLKEKYGEWSSFAIWESEDNVSDISMLNDDETIKSLKDRYIFVALNPALPEPSRDRTILPFKNFHSEYSNQKDYKLCYALKDSIAWGSYITDLFKSIPTKNSDALKNELKKQENQIKIEHDVNLLLEEIKIINENAILIAIGSMTHTWLKRLFKKYNIQNKFYKIIHYSYHYRGMSNKDVYKDSVRNVLAEINSVDN